MFPTYMPYPLNNPDDDGDGDAQWLWAPALLAHQHMQWETSLHKATNTSPANVLTDLSQPLRKETCGNITLNSQVPDPLGSPTS